MAKKMEILEAEILELPDRDRAKLARTLLLSLDPETDADVEEEWFAEAERRYEELKQGVVQAIPSEDVFKEARARLK